MTREQRDELTTRVKNEADRIGLYRPAMKLEGWCRTGKTWNDGIECGEVYSDFWHVKVFDDGTFQIGWLEFRNGTTLVTKPVKTIDEVFSFLAKQR